MQYIFKFICLCSIFSYSSSFSDNSTKFSKGLSRANNTYCDFINEKEAYTTASIPYAELQVGNIKRFSQSCGNLKTGKVVDKPATQSELEAISESLWQHSAALLENPAIFDGATRSFQKEGLVEEINNLMEKTLHKENDDDDQKEKRRINAIHFINGLSYAMGLLSGDIHFNIYEKTERDDLNIREMNPDLKEAMDSCFERLYASSYKGNSIRCSVRGHFIFVAGPKSIEPRYTLLQRRYVADFNQDMGRIKYQKQSPCYVARVASIETVDAWAPNDVLFHYSDDERDITTPLRRLVLSAVNTENFPYEREPIAITKRHMKNMNDIHFEMDEKDGQFLATGLRVTITEHRAKDFFKKAKKGEYAFALLDHYSVFLKSESVEWSDQPFYFMHVNKKKQEQEHEQKKAQEEQRKREENEKKQVQSVEEIPQPQPILPDENQLIVLEDENPDTSTLEKDTHTDQRQEESTTLVEEDGDSDQEEDDEEDNGINEDDQ